MDDLQSLIKINNLADTKLCSSNLRICAKNLFFTNHFIVFQSDEPEFKIMFKSIDYTKPLESNNERRFTPISQHGWTITVYTKDFRIYELTVNTYSELKNLEQILDFFSSIDKLQLHYPFFYKPNFELDNVNDCYSGHFHDCLNKNMNLDNHWRTCSVNEHFTICDSYPPFLIVPASIDDQCLKESARYRSGSRFPLLLYFHKPRKTALLIASEPILSLPTSGDLMNQTNKSGVNNSFIQLGSNNSTNANANSSGSGTSSSTTTTTTSGSGGGGIGINRCKTDEKLLSGILPPRVRGTILDLRTSSEKKKSQTAVDSDQYHSQWRNVHRPTHPVNVLYTTFKKFIDVKLKEVFYAGGSIQIQVRVQGYSIILSVLNASINPNKSTGVLQTSMIGDSLSALSKANFSGITNFANRQSELPSSRSLNDSSFDSDTSLPPSAESQQLSSSNSKRIGAWLALVRESLAAAVTGATAMDAMDAFAQQQLQHEQYLMAQQGHDSSRANLRGSYVLVQSCTGRDRALVVAGLIQVMLNPEARTMKGFQTLIDQTWIQAGHAFSDRCRNSVFAAKQVKNEAPVFILFLDCVWQLMRQYLSSFEFTDEFLYLLVKHAYFSEFGTFLGNSMQDRTQLKTGEKTVSLWAYINQPSNINRFLNPFYSTSTNSPLRQQADSYACWPCLAPQALDVWQELYQRQLFGENSSNILEVPRQLSQMIKSRFDDACEKADELRKTLNQLQEEAIKANLLVSQN